MQLTHHIDDAVLPNVEEARKAHNAKLGGGAPGGSPETFPTIEAFMKFRLDELVRGDVKAHGMLPPPPPDTPAWHVVTRKQGLKALARADTVGLAAPIYEADIQARIDGMPTATPEERLRKYDMQVEFRDAQTWRRGNQFFEDLVQAMEITPEQRDALLQLAATFQE